MQGESLRRICIGPKDFDPLVDEDRHSHLPRISTIIKWGLNPDHEFSAQYNAARLAQMECWADEMRDVAETTPEVARARLITDNMKWVASRLHSSRYGDRMQAEISDPNGDAFGTGAASQLANLIAAAVATKQGESVDDEESLA